MSKDTADNGIPEGFSANPEIIVLSDEAFDKMTEMLESNKGPNPALVALMNRPKRWANNEA